MRRNLRDVFVGALIVVSILAIGVLDLSTGRPYNFSIFYVIPTAIAGWYLGRRFGVAVGILSGLSWDISDYVIRTEDLGASIWNGLTRVAVFGTLAYLTATLRIVVESLRRSRRDLHDLLVQREEFLSLMAHELRAPVAAIEVVATGLSESPTLGQRERRALGQLMGQARDLSTLAEGLLSASQLEAGVVQLEPEMIDLPALAAEIAEPHPRVRLDLPAPPVSLIADRNALRRGISNLVDNALKFSEHDQPVEIRLRRAGGGTFIEVIDHGVGLTPDEASRLFRKHSRIRHQATERVEGVGLGLYLTRLIAEAHRGSVSVNSAGRGLGSTFSLWLPDASGTPAATASSLEHT